MVSEVSEVTKTTVVELEVLPIIIYRGYTGQTQYGASIILGQQGWAARPGSRRCAARARHQSLAQQQGSNLEFPRSTGDRSSTESSRRPLRFPGGRDFI